MNAANRTEAEPVTSTRVLVLAEVGLYRDALSRGLEEDQRFEVVGATGSVEEALTALGDTEAQVVLVDTRMREGESAMRVLANAEPQVHVIALAVPEVAEDVVAVAEAGAAAYVPREGSMEDLGAIVVAVMRGELVCPPEIAATLFRRVGALARDRGFDPIEGRLTIRELEVLRLIEEGRANKEIAAALSIELPTVKNHVHSILQKLNVRRRSEAAARARRLGLWNSTLRADLERTYGSKGSRFSRASRPPAPPDGPIQGTEHPRRR